MFCLWGQGKGGGVKTVKESKEWESMETGEVNVFILTEELEEEDGVNENKEGTRKREGF